MGYPKTARIEFFQFNGSYFSDRDQFKVNTVKFFDVQLISPWKKLDSTFSWRSFIGLDRSFIDCDYCLGARVLTQAGQALGFFDDRMILFALGGVDVKFSPAHRGSNLLFLPVGTLGLRLLFPYDFNFFLENDYFINSIYALSNSSRFSGELRKSFGLQWAIGGSYSRENFEGFENETYHFNTYHYF